MSAPIYFRSLAARCRVSARDCSDFFAKEEFRRLANELQCEELISWNNRSYLLHRLAGG